MGKIEPLHVLHHTRRGRQIIFSVSDAHHMNTCDIRETSLGVILMVIVVVMVIMVVLVLVVVVSGCLIVVQW